MSSNDSNTTKYIIHSCPDRMWYVQEYLVPSMKDQGISNIDIKCDYNHRGNLESCMDIFMRCFDDGGSWHLQDDVIICKRFKELTTQYDDGIVCGYVFVKDHHEKTGIVRPSDMWYSFPCIRIPNNIARECAQWYYTKARYDYRFTSWVRDKKFDDSIFKAFLEDNYPTIDILNLKPNLVDHIDFLIGGSIINGAREFPQTRSQWFEDGDLVSELAAELSKHSRYKNILNVDK